ncbi:malto-oligosyltrehalose trehalohydrolase [Corynebacterium sp. H113]|uniref:malto-oligosyltrehalose trehalohydrolase n=1 Tax=Corynebacterium sp. H113 TaxID=3133419 RepID=UPI0030B3A77D
MENMSNYRVWAPYATEVELLLGDPEAPQVFPMLPDSALEGWFEADVARAPGDRYAFQIRAHSGYGASEDDTPENPSDWTIPLPDPRSQSQPDGPHGFSEIVDLSDYAWKDAQWTGRILPGGVIYELHVGTFSESGDFEGLVEHLDHLISLGVTHIELMPVQPFGGDRNWGYDGVSWHAVHEGYGGPRGLQKLVDTCHNKGLAVIMDVVFNHFGPDGNYVGFFGPYTSGGSTGWGEVVNLMGDHSDEIRAYILDAIRQWFVDYHIDGLRLDAVHALHDEGAFHILEQMQVVAESVSAETGIPRSLIAESDQNDPKIVRPRAAGGFGLTAQWDDDVHHAIHTLVSGEEHSYYGDFGTVDVLAQTLNEAFFHLNRMSTFRGRTHGRGFNLDVQPLSSFVTYTTTHDQTGNRATGDRPSMNLTPAQQALKLAVVAASPFTPMLFQGEEWGASTPFAFFCSHENPELQRLTREGRLREFARAGWDPDEVADPIAIDTFTNSKLNWSELDSAPHAEILSAYQELLALRRSLPQLRSPWAVSVATETDADGRWLKLTRTNTAAGAFSTTTPSPVMLVANFSDEEVTVPLSPQNSHVMYDAAVARFGDTTHGSPTVLSTFPSAAATLDDGVVTLPAWGYALVGEK